MCFRVVFWLFVLTISTVKGEDPCTINGQAANHFIDLEAKDIDTQITVQHVGVEKFGSSKYMEVKKIDDSTIVFDLTEDYRNYEVENDINPIVFYADVTCKGRPNPENPKVNLNVTDTNNHEPEFLKSQYEYEITMPFPPNTDITLLKPNEVPTARDVDLSANLAFSIEGDTAGLFEIKLREKDKKLFPVGFAAKNLLRLKESMEFKIIANDDNVYTVETTIKLNVIPEQTIPQDPRFENALYEASYSEDGGLSVDIIKLEIDEKITDSSFTGKYKEFFEVKSVGSTIEFKIKGDDQKLPAEILEEKYLAFVIEAKIDRAERSGSTVVLIDLPGKGGGTTTTEPGPVTTECPTTTIGTTECPPCTTITEPTTTDATTLTTLPETTTSTECSTTTCPACPECPQTTTVTECPTMTPTTPITTDPTTPIPNNIWYQELHKEYTVDLENNKDHIIDTITVEMREVEPVKYSLSGAETISKFSYSDKGELRQTSKLDFGIYTMTLHAEGMDTQSKASAQVTVIYNQMNTCEDGPLFDMFIKTVQAEENKAFETTVCNSTYSCNLFSVHPPDDTIKGWISVENNKLKISDKLDRENKAFEDMPDAKIFITIIAKTIESSRYFYGMEGMWSDAYGIGEGSIKYEPNQQIIIVDIEDVNDNPPVFTLADPVRIGYPNFELSEIMIPPYVIQVQATDKDEGENAAISYSIDSSDFEIDAEGFIYPIKLASLNEDEIHFTVTATDGGKQNPKLNIIVEVLEKDEVAIVEVESDGPQNIEDILKDLSTITKQTVKALANGYVAKSERETNRFIDADSNVLVLRIAIYALDSKGEPIKMEKLENTIEKDGKYAYSPWNYEDGNSGGHNGGGEDDDNTGYLAAVITLAVLLLIALIVIGVGIFFMLRARREAPDTTYDRIEKQIASKPSIVSAAPVKSKLESVAHRRPTGFVFDISKYLDDEDDDEDVTDTNANETSDYIIVHDHEKAVSFDPKPVVIESKPLQATAPAKRESVHNLYGPQLLPMVAPELVFSNPVPDKDIHLNLITPQHVKEQINIYEDGKEKNVQNVAKSAKKVDFENRPAKAPPYSYESKTLPKVRPEKITEPNKTLPVSAAKSEEIKREPLGDMFKSVSPTYQPKVKDEGKKPNAADASKPVDKLAEPRKNLYEKPAQETENKLPENLQSSIKSSKAPQETIPAKKNEDLNKPIEMAVQAQIPEARQRNKEAKEMVLEAAKPKERPAEPKKLPEEPKQENQEKYPIRKMPQNLQDSIKSFKDAPEATSVGVSEKKAALANGPVASPTKYAAPKTPIGNIAYQPMAAPRVASKGGESIPPPPPPPPPPPVLAALPNSEGGKLSEEIAKASLKFKKNPVTTPRAMKPPETGRNVVFSSN